ncbi:hypothetical protein HX362_004625 [Salmonella enterica]|nr:hypothetical protein [Salmonella enterica]
MKLSKYALLVVSGLMVSAGAMAAGPIDNTTIAKSGTVDISGTIRTATCTVNLPKSAVDFSFIKTEADAAAAKAVLATLPVSVSVSSCANQPLYFTAIADTTDQSVPQMGHFKTGDTGHALGYYVGIKAGAGVSGGDTTLSPGTSLVNLNGSANTSPVKLVSTSATATYDINNIIVKAGATTTAGRLSGSYTYTFSYN